MAGHNTEQKLGDAEKVFVVKHLARGVGPSDLVRMVDEEYGVAVSKQAVARYDPNTVAGEQMAQEYKDLFYAERTAFLTQELAREPLASGTFRMRELKEQLDKLKLRTPPPTKMILEVLEQAAKEAGSYFTNKRELSGPGGAPIEVSQAPLSEEAQVVMAARLKELWDKAAANKAEAEKAAKSAEPKAARRVRKVTPRKNTVTSKSKPGKTVGKKGK